jgi:transposase-like protein
MTQMNEILIKTVHDILNYDAKNAIDNIVKCVFETILYSEREEFLKNTIFGNKGNGSYERLARSVNKYFKFKIPRDRLGLFKPVFLEALKEQESQMQDLAFELYVNGLTTNDIKHIFDKIYNKKISKSSISNITKSFTAQREAWQQRALEKEYYFIYIDALYIPVRRDTVRKEAFYIVLGLRKDLKRDILGVYNIPVESAEGWRDVFKDIKKRGVEKVLMFIADGLTGLKKIVNEEFPASKFQRCVVHKKKNILLKARTDDKELLSADLKKVFKLEDTSYTIQHAKKNLTLFLNKWSKKYPHIVRQFDDFDIDNYFQYLNFPAPIQRMIYTTNWVERLNKGVRKTQRVRNSFPNPESALNLVGAYLMDFEDRVYKHPVTAFSRVQDELNDMLEVT